MTRYEAEDLIARLLTAQTRRERIAAVFRASWDAHGALGEAWVNKAREAQSEFDAAEKAILDALTNGGA